jgi:flagellar protein FliO/FliZ
LRRLASLIFALFLSLSAHANEPSTAGIPAGTYLQATLALLLIIGLLFGVTWAARKVSGGKMFGQGNMRVISGIALGPRERIVLIEVDDQWLVIGIVPGQIRTLHSLPKGSDVASGVGAGTALETPFAEWLKSIRERRNNAK